MCFRRKAPANEPAMAGIQRGQYCKALSPVPWKQARAKLMALRGSINPIAVACASLGEIFRRFNRLTARIPPPVPNRPLMRPGKSPDQFMKIPSRKIICL